MEGKQTSFFYEGSALPKPPAGKRKSAHPNTVAAARQIERAGVKADLQRRVIKFLAGVGIVGATRKEIAEGAHMDENGVAWRLAELLSAGWVERNGDRIPEGKGAKSKCTVWRLTKAGEAEAKQMAETVGEDKPSAESPGK
ncbi:MAG: hypothetical protein AB1405_03610 [Bdellovibrionota bacterium]